jgi:glycosyltransferase involved in cell wall biosynthesis
MTPTVTVIIPTQNRVSLLGRSLRSALLQRHVDIEAVVVNDGSQDDTATFLTRVRDPRVRMIEHVSSRGLSNARNAGIAAARGRWVAFLDDDDLWAPDKLLSQLRQMASDPRCRWSSVGVINVDASTRVIGWGSMPEYDNLLAAMLERDAIPAGGSGVVVARTLLETVGGFDTSLACSEDWDMWIRLAQHSTLAFVRRPLMAYRLWPGSMSHDVEPCERAFDIISARYEGLAAAHGVAPDRNRWEFSKAATYLRRGHRARALQTLARLARHNPDRRRLLKATLLTSLPWSIRLQDYRGRRMVPLAWRAEAENWLAPFRHEHVQ